MKTKNLNIIIFFKINTNIVFMFIIATYDVKFKTNREKIESIFLHYGMRKIQENTFIANNIEVNNLKKDIDEVIKENDSVLLMPICKSCYNKFNLVL